MACNNLGLFALDTSVSLDVCMSARTTSVYGVNLVLGSTLYSDPFCTPGNEFPTLSLSDGSKLYTTNSLGKIDSITDCPCNYLGTFSSNSDPDASCLGPFTFDVYGSNLNVGSTIFSDSGCSSPYITTFMSNGVDIYSTDINGVIESISTCICSGLICVQNDPTYDDTYVISGIYNSQSYYTGQSTGYVIYYSTGETRWCLAQNLNDPCDQFGPYGSTSSCPDLDDTVIYFGSCTTTTTTINPCSILDFDAVFDCYVPPTPSNTPTFTPTPTLTPTPSSTNPCGGRLMESEIFLVSSSPMPTPTPTPTPTQQIVRPCNFSGEAIFNSINEIIKCSNSKKFQDCFTGVYFYTTDSLSLSGSTSLKENYVYNATINNQVHCVIFQGLVSNISGVDIIDLNYEVGDSLTGACLDCVVIPSPTPTQTITPTPTITPSASPCVSYEYRVTNLSPEKITIKYVNCFSEMQIKTIDGNSSIIVCSSIAISTGNPQNIQVEQLPSVCN